MRSKVDPNHKAQAIAMRQCRYTYAQITEATGIPRGTLFNILKAEGLTKPYDVQPAMQVTASPAPAAVVQKFCSKCAKAIVITPAKFCYHCGAALLSEEELLVEELDTALKTLAPLSTIPSRSKDTIRDALVHSITYFEKDK